jgi:hypothetical protein
LDGGLDNGARFRLYAKDLFKYEAKMTPVSRPFLSSLWGVLCYLVFNIVYPKPVTTTQTLVGFAFVGVGLFVFGVSGDYYKNEENMIYNGRRCRFVQWRPYYSTLQDDSQNLIHYPTADLHGLIPLADW